MLLLLPPSLLADSASLLFVRGEEKKERARIVVAIALVLVLVE
jgi:hypothetical protein